MPQGSNANRVGHVVVHLVRYRFGQDGVARVAGVERESVLKCPFQSTPGVLTWGNGELARLGGLR